MRKIDKARKIAQSRFPAPSKFYAHFEWEDRAQRARIGLSTWDDVCEMWEISALKTHSTFTPCSCWCCGNPRKYYGAVTFQEMVAKIDEREQMEELSED